MSFEPHILSFLDEVDEGIVMLENVDGIFEAVYENSSYAKLFPVELAKTKKKYFSKSSFFDFLHPDDDSKLENVFLEVVESGEKQKCQIRFRKKNEKHIWIEFVGLVKEEKGRKFIFCSFRNVDYEVQSELLLTQSELKHRLLFTRANDAIFIIKEMAIVDCNEKTLSMFESPGYSGITGKKLFELMPEIQEKGEDSMLNFHYLLQKTLQGEPQFFYWVFKKFDGTQFEAEVSLSGFSLAEDKFVQVIVRDITARKKAQQEKLRAELAEKSNVELQKEIEERITAQKKLVIAQEYTSSIIHSSIDMIIASDRDGLVTEFNAAAQKAFGYTAEEVIGEKVWKLFESKEESDSILLQILERGFFLGEMNGVNAKGEVFPAYLSASLLINDKGESVGTVGVVKDITELKKTEQELKDNVNQKEVLIKEVHHRVKNNLQVINSILKLQSSFIEDQQALVAIRDCQERIKSMAFIHESLYQSNDLAKVNFAEYLRTLCSNLMFSYEMQGKKIDLDLDVDQVSLSLDSGISCGLIVNELISNALKYAFHHQDEGNIKVKLKSAGEGHMLSVEDDGSGIPKDLDYTKTNSLGFQLVLGLVDQIDGKIEHISRSGTKFIINFQRN